MRPRGRTGLTAASHDPDDLHRALAELADALLAAVRPVDTNPPDELLSVEQAADHLGLGRSLVYELLARQELRSFKVGRRRLVPASAITDFIAAR